MRHPPYSPTEVRGYWSLTQPTPLLRHRMRALLALGLGAGLTGREYYSSTGRDVSTTPDGVTVLQVHGARPREVPVLDDYAMVVRELAETVGGGHLMGGELPRSESSRLWRLTQDLRIPGWLPPINAERLRSTWMAHHLNRGVPLPAFLEAAGLKTTKSCTLLLPYLRQPKPDEAAALMAGRR